MNYVTIIHSLYIIILIKVHCLLAGYSWADSKEIINTLMDRFQITQYKNVKCSKLSGGNQRKVCTAISLIGMPKVSKNTEVNDFIKHF